MHENIDIYRLCSMERCAASGISHGIPVDDNTEPLHNELWLGRDWMDQPKPNHVIDSHRVFMEIFEILQSFAHHAGMV